MRSDWEWRTVADLQAAGVMLVEDGNHGEYRPRPDEFTDDGTRFIRAADMSDGRVLFETASSMTDEALNRIRKGVGLPGDVLFSHKGTVGKVALVPPDAPAFVCSPQTTFWRTLDPGALDGRFLHAYMRSPDFTRQWYVRKGETDMADYVSLTAQRSLLVPVPDIDVQRRLAAVVSAYDELIENTLRRIAILEEMAQAIYREWFVSFRYPGHERDELVGSPLGPIPVGWEVARLGDRLELAYGKALRRQDRRGGDVAVYGSSGVVGWHDRALVEGPGIVVGRKGNVGAVHWSDGDFYPIDTTFFVRTELPLEYVLRNLRDQNFINSDAAVPGLNRQQAYRNPLLVPGADVLERYDTVVEPLTALRRNLEQQNVNLRATRDLLLPKLVSGDVDVSDLEIDTSWLAA